MWSVVVVLPSLQAEFGVDRSAATLPYVASMAAIALGGLFMGRLVDRIGVALPVLGGAICLSLGYLLAGLSTSLLQFTLIQAVLIALLGASTTFGPLVADTSLWFTRRRGIAVAICASGNYLAGTIWPPILQSLIATQGWRTTHTIIGWAAMLSLMLGFGIVSRLASGLVADRIGGFPTLLLGGVLQAGALVLYLLFDSLGSLYVISALFGLFQGGIVPSYALVVRELYPASEAGTRISAVLMATLLGMAVGGWLTGVIFDLTGSYADAFLNGIAWNFLNVGIVALLLYRRRMRLQVKQALLF